MDFDEECVPALSGHILDALWSSATSLASLLPIWFLPAGACTQAHLSPPWSVSPTGACAEAAYPTTSPATGSCMPVPTPEPAYSAPSLPLFSLIFWLLRPGSPILQLLWLPARMITFFFKVHPQPLSLTFLNIVQYKIMWQHSLWKQLGHGLV